MNNLPLVTVGLPVYNRPEGLRRTLECFVNQTYQNIEIIIADNCSPNSEVEKIAKEYVEKDPRISYYRHDENKGWGYNTVFVIEKARGDFFIRATDDGWWDKSYFEKIISLFKGEDSLVMSNFEEVDVEGGKSKVHIPNHLPLLKQFENKSKIQTLKNYLKQFEGYGKAQLFGGVIRTEMMKNEYVKKLLLEEYLACDLLINLFVLTKGSFKVHPEVLFKSTYDNVRYYDTKKPINRSVFLFFFNYNYGLVKDTFLKWNSLFYRELSFIFKEKEIDMLSKVRLSSTVFRRILFFYYDLVLLGVVFKGIDWLKFIRRKTVLR